MIDPELLSALAPVLRDVAATTPVACPVGRTVGSVAVTMDDDEEPGFISPELAALSGWSDTPAANAFVVSVTMHGDSAEVIVDTAPSHPMSTRVDRDEDGLWRLVSDWSI